jgi:ADP-ribosylglycohydrolase
MAAGNGGAMRIAPLAFVSNVDRQTIRDVVRITHRNDEAYLGALAVVLTIRDPWAQSPAALHKGLVATLPDSRVRDRLQAVAELGSHATVATVAAAFGASGYVVDTVPIALTAAWNMAERSFEETLDELQAVGGDADTIGAIAGQVAGARLGAEALPARLLDALPDREMIERIAMAFVAAVAGANAEAPSGSQGGDS